MCIYVFTQIAILTWTQVCTRKVLFNTNTLLRANRFAFTCTDKVLKKVRVHLSFKKIGFKSSLSHHPNYSYNGETVGGLAIWDSIHIVVWSDALKMCCLNVDSQGGSLARHASLKVASWRRNLFRSLWAALSFPFWSYNLATNFLAASIESSISPLARLTRSQNSALS